MNAMVTSTPLLARGLFQGTPETINYIKDVFDISDRNTVALYHDFPSSPAKKELVFVSGSLSSLSCGIDQEDRDRLEVVEAWRTRAWYNLFMEDAEGVRSLLQEISDQPYPGQLKMKGRKLSQRIDLEVGFLVTLLTPDLSRPDFALRVWDYLHAVYPLIE